MPEACDELPSRLNLKFEDGDRPLDWAKLVWHAIMSFPPGSAPGPSGLRPSHLKDCLLKVGVGSTLQSSLAALVEKGATGHLHHAAAPFLCASNLIPLKKKDSGIRPIAVGDTLRRVIGKCLLRTSSLKKEVEALAPRQCGVGVRNAAELVGMSLQRMVDQCDAQDDIDWVVMQVDIKNAFNTVDRTSLLKAAMAKVPSSFSWLRWCYSNECPLYCQGKLVATSSRGVHR